MTFTLHPMTAAAAATVDSWASDPPYDFYNLGADPADRAAFLDPANWAHVRAIAVYERCGFERVGGKTVRTNGADHEFVRMARPA